MQTVAYNIYTTSVTATAQGLASAQIVKAGKIIGIDFEHSLTSGAARGYGAFEVVKAGIGGGSQQASTTNNPPREVIVGSNLFATSATAGAMVEGRKTISGLAIPVEIGDTLSMGMRLAVGTAPADGQFRGTVYVHEG